MVHLPHEFPSSPSGRSSSSLSLNSPSPRSSSSSSTPSVIAQLNPPLASFEYSTPTMLTSPNPKSLPQSTNTSSLSTSSPFFAFDEQRMQILSSSTTTRNANDCDYSVSKEFVVLLCTKVLSKISEEQATRLREVERKYEEVLDNESSDIAIRPLSLILKGPLEGGGREIKKEEMAMALTSALLMRSATSPVAAGEDVKGVEEGFGVEEALYNRED